MWHRNRGVVGSIVWSTAVVIVVRVETEVWQGRRGVGVKSMVTKISSTWHNVMLRRVFQWCFILMTMRTSLFSGINRS